MTTTGAHEPIATYHGLCLCISACNVIRQPRQVLILHYQTVADTLSRRKGSGARSRSIIGCVYAFLHATLFVSPGRSCSTPNFGCCTRERSQQKVHHWLCLCMSALNNTMSPSCALNYDGRQWPEGHGMTVYSVFIVHAMTVPACRVAAQFACRTVNIQSREKGLS